MRSINELIALGISREQMTYEEEKEWVEYWFDRYETVGFTERFHTPYDHYKSRIGQRFTVIGRCTEEYCDLECLPMWEIQFENGFITCAFAEEICKLEIDGTFS